MAALKLQIVLFAFLVAVCTAVEIKPRISDSHNIDECDPAAALVRLLTTNIYQSANFIIPVTRTINFPETGINTHLISCIRVTNLDTSNHGGYPQIANGGVGSYEAEIVLKSQWGQPLNFRIEIWAEI